LFPESAQSEETLAERRNGPTGKIKAVGLKHAKALKILDGG
jgi:hypothetical protein